MTSYVHAVSASVSDGEAAHRHVLAVENCERVAILRVCVPVSISVILFAHCPGRAIAFDRQVLHTRRHVAEATWGMTVVSRTAHGSWTGSFEHEQSVVSAVKGVVLCLYDDTGLKDDLKLLPFWFLIIVFDTAFGV